MSIQLSRREVDELKSSLERAIYRTLGHSDSSVLATASTCLTNGYDRRRITDKLLSYVDSKKANRLAEKIVALAESLVSSHKSSSSSKKRSHESSGDGHRDNKESKKQRTDKDRDKRDGDRDRYSEREKDYVASNGSESRGDGKHNKAEKVTSMSSSIPPQVDLSEVGVDVAAVLEDGESVGAKITGLSADRIKLMMANAQREIEERKRALSVLKSDGKTPSNIGAVNAALAAAAQIKAQISQSNSIPPPSVIKPVLYSQPESKPPPPIVQIESAEAEADPTDKQRKIAELQARIQRKLAGAALPPRPAPLILDREGRTVDVSGRQVQLTHVAPTLKANIRAKRREEFRAQLAAGVTEEGGEGGSWQDARLPARPPARARRALRFHEPGRFVQLAERIRMKAQLEKLQNEISQIARKTGISSATKLALLAPDTPDSQYVPDVEWWDSVILMSEEERQEAMEDDEDDEDEKVKEKDKESKEGETEKARDIAEYIKEETITNLVEHPQQMKPPTEPLKPVYMPVFLTKKERKKLRRQNRREAWKEEQEKVRLGLEAPAEPKLRISNLMRALGTEATHEPTRVEAHVRAQMAARARAHAAANAARALTIEQRRGKARRKIEEDTTLGVCVAVYRVRDLFECAAKKFKVETNAQQLHMTGCVLLHRDCCVVVAEGGPKQHAKYKRLMLHRIKWDEDKVKDSDGQAVPNTCQLVWEGSVKQRSFGEIKFKVCPTEKLAREQFQKHKVEHYWDLAYSGAVLEQADG